MLAINSRSSSQCYLCWPFRARFSRDFRCSRSSSKSKSRLVAKKATARRYRKLKAKASWKDHRRGRPLFQLVADYSYGFQCGPGTRVARFKDVIEIVVLLRCFGRMNLLKLYYPPPSSSRFESVSFISTIGHYTRSTGCASGTSFFGFVSTFTEIGAVPSIEKIFNSVLPSWKTSTLVRGPIREDGRSQNSM